ncbi:response regulator transcription factor [Sulfurimonas sp.]|uniref:response regulator transcription factor n=1 Tax=Sulfurimonas sp. TaxID=2022749 RepID=UPI0025D1E0AF|nr:response regulator transcription factor [Sulfurimonas sp.]MBT5933811.1 response regulator transcription factor [Sulfurimonas sp.]
MQLTNQTILIVEDSEDILDLMEYTLSKDGYDVITCVDTSNVRDILDEEEISAILMDRNLPGIDGSVFISQIREEGYNHPVIYVSAKDSSEDIIEGLDSGGDDYITKPFNVNELKARVKSLIRRTSKKQKIIKYKDITYNSSNKIFSIEGEDVKLTTLEHDLLLEFLKNQNILLSRETLLENVWKNSENKQLKTVNVAIKRLKESIDPKGEKNYIEAVRGEGYKLC